MGYFYMPMTSYLMSDQGFLRTIGVDFDGTICKCADLPEPGEIRSGVRKALSELRDAGFIVIIFTIRANAYYAPQGSPEVMECMIRWLTENEVPYDGIWMGTGKLPANVIIDDRVIEYSEVYGWDAVVKRVVDGKTEEWEP